MKGGIFGHLGGRGTGAKAGQPAVVALRPLGLCWRKSKNSFIPGETIMRRIPLLAGLVLFAFALLPMAAAPAQTAALTGQVSSAEEGVMEGVLVSAKKAGSTITTTVVSDKDGRFSFPAGPARARPVCAPHPRHRLRSRQSQEHRGRGAEDHHGRSQAPQDRRPRGADVERRMDQQHPRQRSAQGRLPQLRGLPHARARHALARTTPRIP